MWPGLWRYALLLVSVSHFWRLGDSVSESWAHAYSMAATAEGRWRAALTALAVRQEDIPSVAYEAEVAAGRATLNAVVQQVPEAPPIAELRAELVLGVRGLVRRVAAVVPHERLPVHADLA